jgi:hypothetical protein
LNIILIIIIITGMAITGMAIHGYLQVMHQSHPPGTAFTTALAEWVDRRSPWAAVVYQMLQD